MSIVRNLLLAAGLAGATLAAATDRPPPRVMFFGDSLAAGYGVGKEKGFPALTAVLAESAGCPMTAVNLGLPGDTSAAGLRRIDWVLQSEPDIFVLELGGNDGLRGVPLSETERNLRGILDRVRIKAPEAQLVVAGVRLPPNLGPEYTQGFQQIFPRVAADYDAALIPRLLEGVAGDTTLMRDPNHPNEAGHRLVAQTVWQVLQPLVCGGEGAGEPLRGAAQNLEGRHVGDAAAAREADDDGDGGDDQ
jgi:acyl-CoA thioesterase-1